MLCVVTQMLINKRGDKKVAVVVTRLIAQGKRVVVIPANTFQRFGLQLIFEEVVALALINKQGLFGGAAGDQFTGIVLRPQVGIVAEVTAESLLSPGTMAWVRDG